MKKLFTLLALLTCFLGAMAEEVIDYEVDYTDGTSTWGNWSSVPEGTTLEFVQGEGIRVNNPDAHGTYEVQYTLATIPAAKFDADNEYSITLKIQGTVDGIVEIGFSGGGNQQITLDGSDQTVTLGGFKNNPTAQYWANSGSFIFQSGQYVGEYTISYVKITHEQAAGQAEIKYKDNMLTNGDAEAAWPAWAFTDYMEDDVNAVWRSDRATEICAWGLVHGENVDAAQEPDPVENGESKSRPFPATIESVEASGLQKGGHAFVVHASEANNEHTDWQAWDNQFFIMAPKGFPAGTQVKLSFLYKASTTVTTNTQVHHQNPSWYLHYQGIGDVTFTEEWQKFEQEVTLQGWSSGDLGYCIAFNLNPNNKEPMDFYIDDISWQEMDFEEGCFAVAKGENFDYDYNAPIVFEEDAAEPGVFTGKVGAEGAYVNEVIISTKSGNKKVFQSGAIKLDKAVDATTVDTWIGYKDVPSSKIQLPVAGIWEITVDTNPADQDGHLIMFTKLAGDDIAEPVDITVNTSELRIEAVQRNYKNADEAAQYGATDLPEDYQYNGQPWDNQFFIDSYREFNANEETVIEFDYYIISDEVTEAKVSSQGQGVPGAYKGGGAGDLTFTTEEQHWVGEFKVPESNWQGPITGVRSMAFNMAEIPQACTYVIKNVKWYLKNTELNEAGQTIENFIPAEGTDNFWAKIGAGTDPYNWTTGPAPKTNPDANNDGKVDIGDVDYVIMAIGEEINEQNAGADTNKDGKIDVSDADFVIMAIE